MLKPLNDNVLVEVIKEEEKKSSIIHVPGQEEKDRYIVAEIGTDKEIKVKKGQEVLVVKGRAMEHENYLIVRNNDILAIVK